MQNQEWIDMFRVIPEEHHNEVVLVLQNGSELAIDTFFRFEPNFIVARGRVAGTTDENRAFFVPYNQMLYYRIERVMKIEELEEFFNTRPSQPANGTANGAAGATIPSTVTPVPAPAVPLDAAATRNALLERIRVARAGQNMPASSPSQVQ